MDTVLEIVRKTTDYFARAGIETPKLDAELIVAHGLGLRRLDLFLQFERPLLPPELDRIRPLVRRRAHREPLQHILGTVEFDDLKLRCDRRALVPRPETEYLVDLLGTRWQSQPPATILDLGTGTGAIALALAKRFPASRVTAVDASAQALDLAQENAAALGLGERITFRLGSWFRPLGEARFAAIVANPPYLTEQEWEEAAPEVRDHDPKGALVATQAGLADLLTILAQARQHLTPGGELALETGLAHHEALVHAATGAGYAHHECLRDLTHRPRFFLATAPGS